MPRGKATVIKTAEYQGPAPLPGTRPLNYLRFENGTEVYTTSETFRRTDTQRVTGPDGEPLNHAHLAPGATVQAEYRGSVVLRVFSIAYDEASERLARARARQLREHRRAIERAEQARRDRESAYRHGDTNPYTFLPYLTYRPDDGFLHRPVHRTAPPPGRHSGRLQVTLTVASPLATYGTEERIAVTHRPIANQGDDDADFLYVPHDDPSATHRVTGLLRDSAGRPTLTGAAVKGALRTWYEFITSSTRDMDSSGIAWRDTVTDDRSRKVGILRLYRDGEPLASLPVDPDRSLPRGVSAKIIEITPVVPDKGDACNPLQIGRNRITSLLEEWQPVHGSTHLHNGDELVRRPGGDDAERAWVQIGVGVAPPSVGVRLLPQPAGGLDALPTEAPHAIEVGADVLRLWWEAHRGGGASQPVAKVSVGGTTVTCHPPDATVLRDAKPVFFQHDGTRITYLSHIRNGRWAVDEIAGNRIPGGKLPDDDDRVDPTGRVFGRITERGSDSSAWAGRLRISRVSYDGGATTECFTLKPLQTPKVQAAGFYLDAGRPDTSVAWRPGKPGRVAGSKVYWHQVAVPDPDGAVDIGQRARITAVATGTAGEPARMQSNTTVEALLDGTFTIEMWFEDLDDHELDALLLAATLRFDRSNRRVGYKLGMGKPLGLGSVRNTLAKLELVSDASPTDLHLEEVDEETVNGFLERGRRHWFGTDEAGLKVAREVAALDALRSTAFGYPGVSNSRRNVDGTWKAEPKAADVLGLRR